MFIGNLNKLAKTKGRRDGLKIIEAGLAAVRTDTAIRAVLKLKGNRLMAGGRSYDLRKFDHLYVIGFGKASYAAAVELEKILGSRISGGIVLDVVGGKLKHIKSLIGSHPLPTMKNVRAAGEIVDMLKQADTRDLIIAVVSGGGSALLCRPYGLKCGELALVTKMLMRRGAEIGEMNTVRKHLSEILGGQFARLAYPAKIIGLVFSDVPGDDVSMIASGPTVLDQTTVEDAARILAKYDIIRACSLDGCGLAETPKDPVFFRNVHNVLAVSNRHAVEAMKKEAIRLGYKARIISTRLEGEAREVGKKLASLPRAGEAIIAGGETTVTVSGKGVGGRNQELALGAMEAVPEDTTIFSCASDGHDNGPAAGGIADRFALLAARRLKLDPKKYLAANDSFPFLKKVSSQILCKPTGINISDLMLALRRRT